MALRYTKPEDCDNAAKAGRYYSSYSCEPAPGGGNECIATGVGGQYPDCKMCLQNCTNDPGAPKSVVKPVAKPVSVPSKSFLNSTVGKVSLGVGGVAIGALIIFLVVRMTKK